MKKLKAFICALVVGISAFCLFACGDKGGGNATLTSAKTSLREFYYITETIDWDALRVVSTYSDKTSKTSDSIEFDIDVNNAKSDTEWVVLTDGLKSETAGNMTAKEYNFIIKRVGTSDSYNQKVTVDTDESRAYELDLWALPESIATFQDRTKTEGDNANPSGFKTLSGAKYYVGNDNGFDVTPNYTLYKIGTEEDVAVNISLDVSVFEGTTEVGDSVYTYSDGKVKFADSVVDRTFTIKVAPTYFDKNRDGDDLQEWSFSVVVKDGYNVYNALDLGMMNIVSEGLDKTQYRDDRTTPPNSYYYNSDSKQYYNESYDTTWRRFLTEKGYSDLSAINAVFIHKDITIGTSDIPEQYFITAYEAGGEDKFANGKYRDHLYVYSHTMEDDFTLEGNYFKVDASQVPVNGNIGRDKFYQTTADVSDFGHSKLFSFNGMSVQQGGSSSEKTVKVNNLTAVGNTGDIVSSDDADYEWAAGGLIMFQNASCAATVENINILNAMIGWYAEITDDVDTTKTKTNTTAKKQETTLNNVNITDCFNCALFCWGSEGGCDIKNSTLARFGGPAIFAISRTNNDGSKRGASNVTYDNTVEISNWIGGNSAWFNINKATEIVTSLTALNQLFMASGKTFLNNENKLNLKVLAMDSSYLGAKTIDIFAKVNGYDFQDTSLKKINGLTGNPPYFWTNGGSKFFTNGKELCSLNASSSPIVYTGAISGTEMCISYPISSTCSAGVVLEIADYTPASN